jgi:hypothetical protein
MGCRAGDSLAGKRRGPRLALGPFDLEGRVGVGAFGEVFRARNRETGEVVAVKSLKPSAERDVALLKREFRRAADLTHPNLVRLYDLYTEDTDCFYSMELLEGCHVSAQTLDQPVTIELIASLIVQGAAALEEIHEAGMVHRDLKPSNMILTNSGRLVVLDFGLLERIGHQGPGFYGSFHFAAPEVANGGPHTRASDWYGLGAVIRDLWHGGAGETLAPTAPLAVRQRMATDVPTTAPARPAPIAEPWGSLLSALTAAAPEERPGYREVMAIATDAGVALPPPAPASSSGSNGTGREPLVGRAAELAALRSFLGRQAPRAPRVAYLRGPSGVGKSALLRRLGAELREDPASIATAYSACREGDRTAYRVLDAAFDDLVPRLARPTRTSAEERAALGVLARMLPCLDRAGVGDPADARALDAPSLWRLAVAGLRLVLRQRSGGQMALLLDDLQWGDEESGRLLADALADGDIPASLVFAMRPEEEALSPFLEVFRERAREYDLTAHTIDLGPLSDEDALTLARHLAADQNAGDDIARMAHGNPFLIELLAQTAEAPRPEGDGSLREVIGRIVEGLPDEERRALEVLSLAVGPLRSEVVAEVIAPLSSLRPTLRSLRDHRLVRTAGPPESRLVNTYHDSVREAVRDRLSDEGRRHIHRGLAERLAAQPDAGHAVVGYHFREAGDLGAAAPHLVEAAREASRALALRRAVELMEQAIEGTASSGLRADLEREHVHLLAAAGLSEQAGARAEELLGGQVGHRDELRRLAVEQFFVGGHVDRGRPLAMEMLDQSGRRWPTESLASNAALSVHLFRTIGLATTVGVTRRRLVSGRVASAKTATDFAVGRGLGSYDPLVGSIFLLRATNSALRERDLDIAAIGLAYAGALAGFSGAPIPAAVGLQLIALAQSQSRRAGYVRGEAFAEVSRGVVRACQGRWRESVECFDRGVARLDQECASADWEANNGKNTSLFSLMNLCELKELGRRVQRYTSEARDRSDLALEVESGLYRSYSLLAEDAPADATENIRETISRWTDSGYHFQHWIAARLEAHRACYDGAGPADLERMQSALRAATRARLTFMQVVRSEGQALIGRLALSRMAGEGPSASLTRVVREAIDALTREKALHATARAASLRAGLALAQGDADGATEHLRVARAAFARAQMAGEELAHAQRIAELTGATALEADTLDVRLRALGVRAPERWVRMLVPIGAARGVTRTTRARAPGEAG